MEGGRLQSSQFERTVAEGVEEVSVESQVRNFTPPPKGTIREENKQEFCGVNLKNLPKDAMEEDVVNLLKKKGMPSDPNINVTLVKKNKNAIADIEGLEAEICKKLIEEIHEKECEDFDRKLYCRPLSRLITPTKTPSKTPVKKIQESVNNDSVQTLALPSIPGLPEADRIAAAQTKAKT